MTFLYKKILVPYDGSKPSENALQQAIQLANLSFSSGSSFRENIQIILLHVVEEIHIRIPNLYFGLRIIAGKPIKEFFKEVYEEMRNEALKMLDDTKKRIESSMIMAENKKNKDKDITPAISTVSVNNQVIVGNPAEVIVDIANNKEKVDLIIMGSTGLKGFSKIRVLGSVSRTVSENANCPIMLVH